MNPNDVQMDRKWNDLLEKFDAFRISFNQKWETNKIALKSRDPEAIVYSHNEILDAWESMEKTLNEINEFQKERNQHK